MPLVFLLVEAQGAGISTVAGQLFRPLTGMLLWNTVRLTVVVTVLCAIIGTGAAWLVERTDLPGRKVWAILLVIPLAIPDFVVSFGWSSMWSWVQGFRGSVLVMTLAVYPLVYLPVAASLRSADPGQEEVARSLGVSRVRTFVRITLGQARSAILGGCLLVALVLLAEYGAFEMLGFRTFTTEIFSNLGLPTGVPTACALSLVLVVISLLVLGGEARAGGRGRIARSGPMTPRLMPPLRLGVATAPALLAVTALIVLALGVPVGETIYLIVGRRHPVGDGLGQRLHAGRRLAHGRLRCRRGRAGHAAGAAGGCARHPALVPWPASPGAQHLPGARHARCRDRAGADVLHRAVRQQRRLPDGSAADHLLRDHVLSAGAGGGQGGDRPRPGRAGRGRPLARTEQARRLQPGHPAHRRRRA